MIYRDSHLVRLLPRGPVARQRQDGQWRLLPAVAGGPAAAGNRPAALGGNVVRVRRDAPSAGFDGYQCLDLRAADPAADVDRQVQAIWATIVDELDLGYINPPPSYSTEMDSQRLRTPSMIVKDRSGTCIDPRCCWRHASTGGRLSGALPAERSRSPALAAGSLSAEVSKSPRRSSTTWTRPGRQGRTACSKSATESINPVCRRLAPWAISCPSRASG